MKGSLFMVSERRRHMPESSERGALTEGVYYILLSLCQPLHGYGIMQKVSEMSDGRVSLGAGTLYGALNTLVEKGWIQSVGSQEKSRKKEYCITAAGQQAILREMERLQELLDAGKTFREEKT